MVLTQQVNQFSFEKCFEHPLVYEAFSKYLKKSLNLELLNFVEQISDFNLLFSETYKQKRAKVVIERFINVDSTEEINIPGSIRKETITKYEEAVDGKTAFDFNIFYEAFRVVYNDLRLDAWPKFIFSTEFSKVMAELESKMSTEEFEAKFVASEDEKKKTIIDLEYFKAKEYQKISDSKTTNELKASITETKVSTVNIAFDQKDLDSISFKAFNKAENVNKMIVEMMTPFTGVHITLFTKKRKKSLLGIINSVIKKKEEVKIQHREFKKSDLFDWLSKYFHTTLKDENLEKILKLLFKYNVIKNVEGAKDHFYFNLRKKVIIVGCGFAGMMCAKLLRDEFDVTVIDKNINMKFNISFYKLFSNPEYIKKLEIPMTTVAKECKFIQEEIKNISPSAVYLKDDSSLAYDYLIVATGMKYNVPFTITENSTETNDQNCRILFPYDPEQILSNEKYLKSAKHIVVVGTGPVGVEIIGEIAMTYKNTKVTAITQSARLLERQSPVAHKVGMSYLKEFKNLEILFQRSVTKIEGKKIYFKKSETESSIKNIEESLEVDVIVICVGLRPNTEMFKTFMSDSLNVRGFVEVNEAFQVKYGQNNWSEQKFQKEKQKDDEKYAKEYESFVQSIKELSEGDKDTDDTDEELGNLMNVMYTKSLEDQLLALNSLDAYSNIFAIGDIANIKDEKLAYFSVEHGKRVGKYIKATELSNDFASFKEKISPYHPGKSTLQVLSFGKKGILMNGYNLVGRGGVVLKMKNNIESYFVHDAIPE